VKARQGAFEERQEAELAWELRRLRLCGLDGAGCRRYRREAEAGCQARFKQGGTAERPLRP
jgi:hypothetical protein